MLPGRSSPTTSRSRSARLPWQPPLEEKLAAVDSFMKGGPGETLEDIMESITMMLLEVKPDNPKKWLLEKLERDLSMTSEQLSETQLHQLFAVSRKITSVMDSRCAITLILSEAKAILNCDFVSLFIFDRTSRTLRLASTTFQNLKRLPHPDLVEPGEGVAGIVFNKRSLLNIPDCHKDIRYDRSFDLSSGYVTRSLICLPIICEDSCCGVIQAVNKLADDVQGTRQRSPKATPKDSPRGSPIGSPIGSPRGTRAICFERSDEMILKHLTDQVAKSMRNGDIFRQAMATSARSAGLLSLIRSLAGDVMSIKGLLMTIIQHINKIASAQRSTIFFMDELQEEMWSVCIDTGQEIRIPIDAGSIGVCVKHGKVINVSDASTDDSFDKKFSWDCDWGGKERKGGFKTKTVLCVPMFDAPVVDGQNDRESPPPPKPPPVQPLERARRLKNRSKTVDLIFAQRQAAIDEAQSDDSNEETRRLSKRPGSPGSVASDFKRGVSDGKRCTSDIKRKKVICVVHLVNKDSSDWHFRHQFDDADVDAMLQLSKFVMPKLVEANIWTRLRGKSTISNDALEFAKTFVSEFVQPETDSQQSNFSEVEEIERPKSPQPPAARKPSNGRTRKSASKTRDRSASRKDPVEHASKETASKTEMPSGFMNKPSNR